MQKCSHLNQGAGVLEFAFELKTFCQATEAKALSNTARSSKASKR